MNDLVQGCVDVEPREAVGLILLESVAPVDQIVALCERDVLAIALCVHLAVIYQVSPCRKGWVSTRIRKVILASPVSLKSAARHTADEPSQNFGV